MDLGEENLNSSSMSELIRSLKSSFQNAYFSRVEKVLVYRDEIKKREIEIVSEKLEVQVLENIKLQRENAELKQVNSRLREDQDGFDEKLKSIEDDKQVIIELKRINSELESAKLKAEAEAEIYKKTFEKLELRVLKLEKDFARLQRMELSASKSAKISGEALGEKAVDGNDRSFEKPIETINEMDSSVNDHGDKDSAVAEGRGLSGNEEVESRSNVWAKSEELVINQVPGIGHDKKGLLGTDAGPSCHSSHRHNITGREKSLSKDVIDISDSDDESAPCDISSAREMEIQKHMEADSGKTVAENEMGVRKRTRASFEEKNENSDGKDGSSEGVDFRCPVSKYKRTKFEEYVPISSPVNLSSATASNPRGEDFRPSKLTFLEPHGDKSQDLIFSSSSSSSSSSDSEDLDLELDYPSLYKTASDPI